MAEGPSVRAPAICHLTAVDLFGFQTSQWHEKAKLATITDACCKRPPSRVAVHRYQAKTMSFAASFGSLRFVAWILSACLGTQLTCLGTSAMHNSTLILHGSIASNVHMSSGPPRHYVHVCPSCLSRITAALDSNVLHSLRSTGQGGEQRTSVNEIQANLCQKSRCSV